MTLSERMVEATADVVRRHSVHDMAPGEAEDIARAALTAALAVAEEAGAGVFVVPANKGADFHKPTDDWAFYPKGWNDCRAATLAGRVTL
jgi:hypothetical protein